ncbi:MAG TPA: HAMP domain-containing sensor histidine kinase [Candidatus Angelobacter sp.]
MTVSYFWRSRNSRTALIVLLLLISLATASILALHAYYSDVSQRATAENVLHDYSALVADEVIRRSAVEIGYSGYYPLIGAVAHEIQQSGELSAETKTAFLSAPDARLKRAAALAKSYFQMDRSTGQVTFIGEEPHAEAPAWLRKGLLGMSAQHGETGQVIRSPIGETPRIFIAGATRGPQGREKVAGFEIDLPVLTQWFGAALNRQPLVPPSLGHGQVTNAFVQVSIRDHGGVERFRLGEGPSPRWAVTKPFGDIYQGIFSGFTVETSIDSEVARQIVIGGLPRSRLPFFLGMLALNAGLIVTAILQLRREMALQKLRDEFVSSVSHELRTPLTQIRMFAETLLLDRIRTDEEHRRSLEIIDREARRLTQLVENVLQFSRSERKIESMAKEERELAPLIHEIVDDFASAIHGDQPRFECRLCSGLSANVDPDALRQIVINLLDNALKYGPKQQVVIVGLERRDGMASIFVEDEGPGIPLADRKRIFEHFQRLERDRQSATAGTGIGLSVVKDLVTRHGGRYSVMTGDRGGARFVVELPLVAADGVALQEPAEEPR